MYLPFGEGRTIAAGVTIWEMGDTEVGLNSETKLILAEVYGGYKNN